MVFKFQVREHWRKIATGDPNKRVRDYMTETPQVKMKDKFSEEINALRAQIIITPIRIYNFVNCHNVQIIK